MLHDSNAHVCHANGCDVAVHPRLGFCEDHWKTLPDALKQALWRSFTPMQEYRKRYSNNYLRALRDSRNYLMMRDALDENSMRDIGKECLYCRGQVISKRCEICFREPEGGMAMLPVERIILPALPKALLPSNPSEEGHEEKDHD